MTAEHTYQYLLNDGSVIEPTKRLKGGEWFVESYVRKTDDSSDKYPERLVVEIDSNTDWEVLERAFRLGRSGLSNPVDRIAGNLIRDQDGRFARVPLEFARNPPK